MFDFKGIFFFDKVSAQGYTMHFKRPKLIFPAHIFVSWKDFNLVEFVRVIRFAEFKKKLEASHVLRSSAYRANDQ